MREETCIKLYKYEDAPIELKRAFTADEDFIIWVEETLNDSMMINAILQHFEGTSMIDALRLDDGNWVYGIYLDM